MFLEQGVPKIFIKKKVKQEGLESLKSLISFQELQYVRFNYKIKH